MSKISTIIRLYFANVSLKYYGIMSTQNTDITIFYEYTNKLMDRGRQKLTQGVKHVAE